MVMNSDEMYKYFQTLNREEQEQVIYNLNKLKHPLPFFLKMPATANNVLKLMEACKELSVKLPNLERKEGHIKAVFQSQGERNKLALYLGFK